MNPALQEFINDTSLQVNRCLEGWTQPADAVAPRVTEAMRYSLMNGGKRIRPTLVYAAARAVSVPNEATLAGAGAVECIHAYSLIHDDLPAMDNDDLRRGKPTCHIAFDEATAILAGDGLQTLAFEKLSTIEDPATAVAMIRTLALASGDKGMVAGQMIDMESEGLQQAFTISHLEKIHRHKTGALIRAAVLMGARSVQASQEQTQSLIRYADAIGLAFQVQDDILDVISDTATLGKRQGADLEHEKATYVSLLGLREAREKARDLHATALSSLQSFASSADPLRWVADYIVTRSH
ncbi:(2E,6E)-farnesyl diphosphate synthase [Teredinibacter turnerae]|uniref:(2E,6E)-farnesyl diphosphate synthase n=1 Tax=Teredinibacter turnerae TaxID=2426 RepID=UPI000416845E|nr:farnesyl diphosphate synthase [Teredinibacter turnerae]